ncbi:hypothetical protein KDL45_11245 [bacterium]|nr:hypothetical protein [bacterium]
MLALLGLWVVASAVERRPTVELSDATVPQTGVANAAEAPAKPTDVVAAKAPDAIRLDFQELTKQYEVYRKTKEFSKDWVGKIDGKVVAIKGSIVPADAPAEEGKITRFWLSNPLIVYDGCQFCAPPSMADLIYVNADENPLLIDMETLYLNTVTITALGKFHVGRVRVPGALDYVYKMDLEKTL